MLFDVNKNGRSATSGVGAKAVSASAVKHNAGRDAVFNANIIKVEVWLNKLKLLALGLILVNYKLKSSIRSA